MLNRDILPPEFLKGGMGFDDTVLRQEGGDVVHADAGPDIHHGPARTDSSVRDLGEVEYGEVLVASNTDPGWTAVSHRLGVLVTETDGVLSHGAVVSREYGTPAVTAVKGATPMMETGQTLTVDGNEGMIRSEE